MAKTKQFSIEIDGKTHNISFTAHPWTGNHELKIDGQNVMLKNSLIRAFAGIDQPIKIGGKECRFVLVGTNADIAVDGKYVDSKRDYVPLKGIPWWCWIFVAACVGIPIVAMGGFLPIVIALCAMLLCIRISTSLKMSTLVKVLLCLGTTLIAWEILVLLNIGLAALQHALV